jgi:AcrR family transcriptional regulator
MPRINDATRESRRRHVMESAWICFSRNGFHATTMDEIIAETGMSSSSVYRYFASKDDLIDVAAEESLTIATRVLNGLLEQSPLPGPQAALAALVDGLRARQSGPGYDLSKITINAWGEALRRPRMRAAAHRFYSETHAVLETLADRWAVEGTVAATLDPTAIADLFITLMPGMLVAHHLYELPPPETLVEGMRQFVAAPAPEG